MELRPLEDKVIVKPIKEEAVSASGLIIQRAGEEKPSEGIVVAVGPGLEFANGSRMEIDLNPGDRVAYSKFAGVEYEEYLILPYRDILAVLG